jgi:alginate O-acetyltransferase complex protein AlgJ
MTDGGHSPGTGLIAAGALLVAVAAAQARSAEPTTQPTTAPASPAEARAQAIRQAREALEAELAEHGGSWDAWAERLEGFRADLEQVRCGPYGIEGLDGWHFHRGSVLFLLADRLDHREDKPDPVKAIVDLDRQLKDRGIDLIFVPLPDKLSVYPDKFSARAPADRRVSPVARRFMLRLLEADVEVVDLYGPFLARREQHGDEGLLYYTCDTHWRSAAARLAAGEIAQRLKRYPFVRSALAEGNPFTTEPVVARALAGLLDEPQRSAVLADDGQKDPCASVRGRNGQRYRDVPDSPILLTTDSFGQVHHVRSANLSAYLALETGLPVTWLQGSASGPNVPWMLARKGPGYLRGRRVVIWTSVARLLYTKRWRAVKLP